MSLRSIYVLEKILCGAFPTPHPPYKVWQGRHHCNLSWIYSTFL